jgi:PAS domain S-box-containing protein
VLPGPGVEGAGLEGAGVSAQAALLASGHAFSVVDARLPDLPLVWVNPAFERLTGHRSVDVIGRNCRFLQGPATDRAAVDRIRQALTAGDEVTETLVNYRPDGSSWWNQVTITPVRDQAGELTHFVGVQGNADARMLADRQRDDARTAASVAEGRLYANEHSLALALQRSLLPVLPAVPGLDLAARYIPASDSAEIGGDWYDVLPLPDGATGIAIGDVMGHDMRAAGAMGQLRSVLRSYAWEGHGPAEVLERLNQLVCGLEMAQLATCIYARIEPARRSRTVGLRWSNAGHPPPLLRTANGGLEVLSDGAGVLIGIATGNAAIHERPSSYRELSSGSTLLFYTDGLVENRHQDIDTGIGRLADALTSAGPALSVDDLSDRIAAAAGHSDHDDDQCLLIVRIQ